MHQYICSFTSSPISRLNCICVYVSLELVYGWKFARCLLYVCHPFVYIDVILLGVQHFFYHRRERYDVHTPKIRVAKPPDQWQYLAIISARSMAPIQYECSGIPPDISSIGLYVYPFCRLLRAHYFLLCPSTSRVITLVL